MILNCFRYPASNTGKPYLTLLHGLGGTGNLWRPIGATLEDDFQLLCPDQRGHGGSIPPANDWDFSPATYARDVCETAEHLQFHPSWVIGHSMGVRTAVGYAKLSPEHVLGLVLIDLGFEGLAGGGVGEALAGFLEILPEEFASRADARAFMEQHCPDPAIGQYLIAVSQPSPSGGVRFPFSHDALRRTVDQAQGTDTAGALREFEEKTGRPVYVLRGARSSVYLKDAFEKDRASFASLANVHFVEFEGAGHGLPFEKRAEFVARLREWIALG